MAKFSAAFIALIFASVSVARPLQQIARGEYLYAFEFGAHLSSLKVDTEAEERSLAMSSATLSAA